MARRPPLLPARLLLLLLAAACALGPPPAAALPWSDAAGSQISSLAVNLTRSFMQNQTCTVREGADWEQLAARLQAEAVRIINASAPAPRDPSKNVLRFQQDPVASAPQNYYYAARYALQGFDGSIAIRQTPPFHNTTALTAATYSTVSMAADVRWTDVAGDGSEAVPAPDPSVLFHPWFMYYRRDVLAAHNMTPPATWDGLLAAAAYLNGTDIDGDGRGEHAICFNANYHCQQSYMLLAIFASMLQTHPKDSPAYTGAWFNATAPPPAPLEPLVDNAAMARALEIYARLAPYNYPLPPDACGPHSEAFAAGKCTFTFNMEQFRFTTNTATTTTTDAPTPPSPAYGNLGTALCPGSPYVLDPPSNTLRPCNATTCPLAYAPPDGPPAPPINRAPLNLAIRTQLLINNDTSVNVLAFRYNYFQYSLMDWSASYVGPILTAVAIRADPPAPPPGATPPPANSSTPDAANPRSRSSSSPPKKAPTPGRHQGNAAAPAPASPRASPAPSPPRNDRRMLLAPPGPPAGPEPPVGVYKEVAGLGLGKWPYNVSGLVGKGWHLDDALSFIRALQTAWSHPNTVMDNFMPGSAYYRLAMADAATNATRPGANTSAIAATLAGQWRLVASLYDKPDVARRIYRSCMGMPAADNSTSRGAAGGGAGGRRDGSDWKPAYTAALVTVVAVAVAAVVLAGLMLRARARGRTLLGAVIAPTTGASTTLLVTDIQNSTVMWEQLPAALMEEVLRIHHATLRSLLDRHRGYESATEGDSFILAFHTPADALAYAMAAQAALLDADWPADLLATHSEAALVNSCAVKGNPEVELSYVVRRLQHGYASAAADTLTLASHAITLRTVRSTNRPPAATDPSCPALRTAAARAAAAAQGAWRAAVAAVVPGAARRTARREHDLRSAAFGGSLAGGGDGEGWEGGPAEATSSSLSSGAASMRSSSCTFGWALSQAWVQPEGDEMPLKVGVASPATTLTWRGVRVRMGIHSGLSDPLQAAYNKASRRMHYSGSFADTAKSIADAAHGGQVLLSDTAFAALSAEDKNSAQLIMMLGEFEVLGREQAPLPLYTAVPRVLGPRLRCFPPLRVPRTPAPGVLEAPIGIVTMVFMKATGVATLAAWDAGHTQAALQLYHSTVSALVPQYSGYVVEMADELALLAFQRPEAAIGWALAAQAALLDADWPQDLLEHELCEPITTTIVAAAADSNQVVRRLMVHSRGLRLKVGVAMGPVVDSVNEATGRMAYRGKVMNRAARITSAASTGQVLTHAEAWAAAAASLLVAEEGITATSTGHHTLKGIRHPTELFSCTHISQGSGLEVIPSMESRHLPLLPLVPSLPLHPSGALLDPHATTDSSVLLAACESQGGAPSSSRSPSPPRTTPAPPLADTHAPEGADGEPAAAREDAEEGRVAA